MTKPRTSGLLPQENEFVIGEGDRWFNRNHKKMVRHDDPVMAALRELALKPKSILEIGASNGWRVAAMKLLTGAELAVAVEPSSKAVRDGQLTYPTVNFICSTASHLPRMKFDLVVFGFCLYLIDRENLFQVIAESDRVLRDDGYLIIYDFSPAVPVCTPYKHRHGIYSFKMDHSQLFLANPSYKRVYHKNVADSISVVILKKHNRHGYETE